MKKILLSLTLLSVIFSCQREGDLISVDNKVIEKIKMDTLELGQEAALGKTTTLLAESNKINILRPTVDYQDLNSAFYLTHNFGNSTNSVSIVFRLNPNGNMRFYRTNMYGQEKDIWFVATNTGNPAYTPILMAQTNGNLVLYKNEGYYSANDVLWNSNTWVASGVTSPSIKIQLFEERSIYSGLKYIAKLILEGNGYYRHVIAEGEI